MRIPTRQVHNVLNAYARRLRETHKTAGSMVADTISESIRSYSGIEKRRLIIDKITANIIDRMSRSGPGPKLVAETSGTPQTRRPIQEIRYHILTNNGDKIPATMKVPDSDVLIKQLEEIARNSSEK